MRITVFLVSCCVAVNLAGCLRAKRGPPEFLLGARPVPSPVPSGGGSVPSGGGSYADAAAVLAAAAGAAAVNREVYDTCYTVCEIGTACDPVTGLCVRLPCGGKCPADRRCKLVEGKEACVLGEPDRGGVPVPAEPGAGNPGPGGAAAEAEGAGAN
ncbi:hypothetical protein WMF04_22775 [Sorangium sp. So ce260]|uniref:hypothetical protein n=1 Tax=Sorangium sp. So ce260 TaxID=3133291 RepID=UPI003F5E4602